MLDAVAWFAIAAAILVLVTQFFGTHLRVIAVAQALTPFAVPVLVALAVAASLSRRPTIGFSAALAGCGYLAVLAPLVFAGSGPAPAAGGPQLTIVSANMLFRNDRIDDAADRLRALDADVLALSEVTPEIAARLAQHPLARDYPHRIDAPARAASGLMVWSRTPLGPVGDPPVFRRAIDTTVVTDAGLVRILLLHPPPPVFDLPQWEDELDAVATVVGQTTFSTVVLGDFNASFFHPPYRRMVGEADLHDALADEGLGLKPTWPTDGWLPPFATLDHILLDQSLATLDADVIEIPGSDHLAVVATITFADNP